MEYNKLPALKQKNNIFSKLINFLSKLFKKRERNIQYFENNSLESIENNAKTRNEFQESLRENLYSTTSSMHRLDEVIAKIESQPDLLERLNVSQLKKIRNYYNLKLSNIDNKISEIVDMIEKEPDMLMKLDTKKLKVINGFYNRKLIAIKNV